MVGTQLCTSFINFRINSTFASEKPEPQRKLFSRSVWWGTGWWVLNLQFETLSTPQLLDGAPVWVEPILLPLLLSFERPKLSSYLRAAHTFVSCCNHKWSSRNSLLDSSSSVLTPAVSGHWCVCLPSSQRSAPIIAQSLPGLAWWTTWTAVVLLSATLSRCGVTLYDAVPQSCAPPSPLSVVDI